MTERQAKPTANHQGFRPALTPKSAWTQRTNSAQATTRRRSKAASGVRLIELRPRRDKGREQQDGGEIPTSQTGTTPGVGRPW
jgi:hypothetical protein